MSMERLFASISSGGGSNGVAHTNKFEVRINPPGGTNSRDAEVIQLRCDAATMPSRTMNTTPNYERYGPVQQVVDGFSYEDVTLSFLADEAFDVRSFFEGWQGLTYNGANYNMGYYDDYTSNIVIHALNKNYVRTYSVKLHEAFPKTINAQEFNMATQNELQKVSVVFAYRMWTQTGMGDSDWVDPDKSRATTVTNGVETIEIDGLPLRTMPSGATGRNNDASVSGTGTQGGALAVGQRRTTTSTSLFRDT